MLPRNVGWVCPADAGWGTELTWFQHICGKAEPVLPSLAGRVVCLISWLPLLLLRNTVCCRFQVISFCSKLQSGERGESLGQERKGYFHVTVTTQSYMHVYFLLHTLFCLFMHTEVHLPDFLSLSSMFYIYKISFSQLV